MYKVIKSFADMMDNGVIYEVGDVYPRDGVEQDAARIKMLASNTNRYHEPLIALETVKEEKTAEEKKPEKRTRKKKD